MTILNVAKMLTMKLIAFSFKLLSLHLKWKKKRLLPCLQSRLYHGFNKLTLWSCNLASLSWFIFFDGERETVGRNIFFRICRFAQNLNFKIPKIWKLQNVTRILSHEFCRYLVQYEKQRFDWNNWWQLHYFQLPLKFTFYSQIDAKRTDLL